MGADAKRKEARKRKFEALTTDSLSNTKSGGGLLEATAHKFSRGTRVEKEDAGFSNTPTQTESTEEPSEADVSRPLDDTNGGEQDKVRQKSQRFIVFTGNLPFTATDESISRHFSKVQPKSIRHRTDKETGKSKGFAFLEFEGYDRMKTCLKLYHGSNFDDGVSPSRKLNIELTAGGGGGKSKDRKTKLRAKNQRLNEQRIRRAQEEKKIRKGENNKCNEYEGMESQVQEGRATNFEKKHKVKRPLDNGEIHPSRRSRMAIIP